MLPLIGDGEEAVVELVDLCRRAKAENRSRRSLLEELSRREGFYIPEFFDISYRQDGCIAEIRPLRAGYPKVRRRFLPDLGKRAGSGPADRAVHADGA